MDRILPSMRHSCSSGLPGLPEPIENHLRELADLNPALLTSSELEQLDSWLEARIEPIRRAKDMAGNDTQTVRRLLGWK